MDKGKQQYPSLFQPGRIGPVQLRNRIVMPAMATNFANADGSVTDQLIRYYAARAKGGAGLIIVEGAQVDYPRGKDVVCQLRIDDLKYATAMYDLTEAIHNYGAMTMMQLQHSGRQTSLVESEGVELISASAVPDQGLDIVPREMTIGEIHQVIRMFADSARYAKAVGFDGVEIHGGHGYIINQFLSPHANKRVDQYGGSFQKRMRFALEIVAATRAACGADFPIGFRLGADEFLGDEGLTLADGQRAAKMLEAAGVAFIHVTCATSEYGERKLEPQGFAQGWRLYLSEAIKAAVSIPVIAVGVLRTPEVCEAAIAEGKADFVAIGRGQIADPDWANKARLGKGEEIRRCISCNQGCIGGQVRPGRKMRCTVNPAVGNEGVYDVIRPIPQPKSVVVVGGGPGGMQAAITAGRYGHRVTLLEKESALGGQLNVAQLAPDKEFIAWVTQWQSAELERLGVDVRLETEATAELVAGLRPDQVIVATGSLPVVPRIKGAEGVAQSWDVLRRTVRPTGSAVIIGGGIVGCEIAHLLAEAGVEVTVLEMLDTVANGLEYITRGYLLKQLAQLGVKLVTDAIVLEITGDGVAFMNKSGRPGFLPTQNPILSIGQRPVGGALVEALEARDIPVRVIGDAQRVAKIIDAVRMGFQAVYQME